MGAGKRPAASAGGIRLKGTGDAIIRSLYAFKYWLQNFRLLPTVEKAQVLLVVFIIVVLVAAALVYLFVNPTAPRPADRPVI